MSNSRSLLRASPQIAAGPLTDAEAIEAVMLFQSVPPFVPEPIAKVARQCFAAAPGLKAKATIRLAVWPDGTCSMMAYNADWPHPRAAQVLRAYRAAYLAGAQPPHMEARRG